MGSAAFISQVAQMWKTCDCRDVGKRELRKRRGPQRRWSALRSLRYFAPLGLTCPPSPPAARENRLRAQPRKNCVFLLPKPHARSADPRFWGPRLLSRKLRKCGRRATVVMLGSGSRGRDADLNGGGPRYARFVLSPLWGSPVHLLRRRRGKTDCARRRVKTVFSFSRSHKLVARTPVFGVRGFYLASCANVEDVRLS